jgi:hypothetical protein
MVDALRSAWRVLRPKGLVVDVRPPVAYRPGLAILRDGDRLAIGTFLRTPDPDVVAAQRAVGEAVREGWFEIVSRTRGRWRAGYGDLAELRDVLAANQNWDLDPDTRRRLARAWRGHGRADAIEVSRVFSLTILRKRGVRAHSSPHGFE